jgi:hypothetical protein
VSLETWQTERRGENDDAPGDCPDRRTPVDAQRNLRTDGGQSLRKQLRERRAKAERCPPRASRARRGYGAAPAARAQARRALADGLGRAARALLRQPRRLPQGRTQLGPRPPRLARSAGRLRRGDRGGLRQRQCVASRVRRNGAVAGGRLRMGAPHLLATAGAVLEPDRDGSHAGGRRRRARARPGHVRARLPDGLRRERDRVHRHVLAATSTGRPC